MTTYVLGDDLYDESFSIDTGAGEFMGEYGVGVSEAIGVGEPKKVTALEIWLFDKNDIKTATKVLMSQYAFNDPSIRPAWSPRVNWWLWNRMRRSCSGDRHAAIARHRG
jgi:hypothetical protein